MTHAADQVDELSPSPHPLSTEPLTGTARLAVEIVLSLAETMRALPLDDARQAIAAARAELRGQVATEVTAARYGWLATAGAALGMAQQLAACVGHGELQAHTPFGEVNDAPDGDPVPDDWQ